ncbi:hypothetical protein EPUL_005808 [Erysiphe pulchra]|uniref:Uncharacterized protein n=1 Tax=Erysiphe pulchra TaxID=225359 RepID=A0A2S4PNV7_9PEZI|nr:hypothetical protein EPUL_005808 [Erysiphe pulchra]
MIVRLANNRFAKCWRVDSQRSEASIYSVEGSNGYECGSEFILDSTIIEFARIARENLNNGNYYPLRYRGNLYNENLGYKIWPIYHIILALHRTPTAPRTGTFFIVINSTGQLRDVIARTSKNNHIRCMRASKHPDADQLSKTFAKTPRFGYICHDVFYDDNYLQRVSQIVQSKATKQPKSFFRHHDGAPFYSPCILWPLNTNGISLKVNPEDKNLLALAPDFSVMHIVIEDEKNLIPCEKVVVPGDRDRNIYRITSDIFSHKELALSTGIVSKKRKFFSYLT